jgi:hypothetical protein
MRFLRRCLPLLGLVATLMLSGCGSSSSLLSRATATQLSAQLTQVQTALSDYNCHSAATALANFRNDISQLQGVNATLLSMLNQGAHTVGSLASRNCPVGSPAKPSTTTTTTHTQTQTQTKPPTTTTTTAPAPSTTAATTSTSGAAAPTTSASTTTAPTQTQPPAPPSGGAGLSGSSAGSGSPHGGGAP